jgi:hypothetical protein
MRAFRQRHLIPRRDCARIGSVAWREGDAAAKKKLSPAAGQEGQEMEPRYRTPADLVEALHARAAEAREQLRRTLGEPLGRLMGQLVTRHQMPQQRERLALYALHLAETWLRTRPAGAFRAMSWPAFRSASLVQVAKLASQPFGDAAASGAGPRPLPECPVYDCQTFFRPHQRVGELWFGGDWFGGRHADDGALWVIVADVTGHGYQAYLLASGLPGVWENCWQGRPPASTQPAELLAAMHELLCDCLPDGAYVECTLVRLGPEGEATVAPAGGARLLLRRRGTPRPDLHKLRGTWLGLNAPSAEDQRAWRLEQGDELLLGSDGLFDQLGEQHSDEVVELLGPLPHTAPLFESVRRLVEEALARGPQRDDITMVLLRRRSRVEGAAPGRPWAASAARGGPGDVPV